MGLAKLAPSSTYEEMLPQVDMFSFQTPALLNPPTYNSHGHNSTNVIQCHALTITDSSSREHHILRELFNDQNALSTVRLLQLGHLQQKEGGGPGFLLFSKDSCELSTHSPEAAQDLYFPHLDNLNLRALIPSPAWKILQERLIDNSKICAYITPGPIADPSNHYIEIGALVLDPHRGLALITNNHLLSNGGLGSPVSLNSLRTDELFLFDPVFEQWKQDIRPGHKTIFHTVADPIDIVTGAFYIDEVDLILPGPFPLQIRRNYNSQNPLLTELGRGWKFSLNPYLIEQDGKLYAAETDGTVIAYEYNPKNNRWEITPENNPGLYHLNPQETHNPHHAYILNNVLHSPDGSLRHFKDGLLQTWIDASGNTLQFIYHERRLDRIENSSGGFLGFRYNPEGMISEIYAQDGRRVCYQYNKSLDLIQVTLPNTAIITYSYDTSHRLNYETKPHGRFLHNSYNEHGQIIEQRTPDGPRQQMITTASFDYQTDKTIVTDGRGAKTTYYIYNKQIYRIVDPIGNEILQSWYIDANSWFDPTTASVQPWVQKGSFPMALKTTTDKRKLTSTFLYDGKGNLEQITIDGDDLTGSGERSADRHFSYNDLNLCIQEQSSEEIKITTYDDRFPYLPKIRQTWRSGALYTSSIFKYNHLGQLEEEDHDKAVTCYTYDGRGFVKTKTQKTSTSDPDLVTTYTYNTQGSCTEAITTDKIESWDYDIMGNPIFHQVHSLDSSLLAATYVNYNLNNNPISKQTANTNHILYFDYHASGRLKATRYIINQETIAYTLYENDPCGNLICQVDPLGWRTERTYDLIGQLLTETKGGMTTTYSYECGGQIASITTPSGATTTRSYTTNGLLTKETYPDGTLITCIYDLFGRPIQETKNGITWQITYNDALHQIIRTQLPSQSQEVLSYDLRGNLISQTDAAGYSTTYTYDGLNRPKTHTTPSGYTTGWNYLGATVICTHPSQERTLEKYAAGKLIATQTFDSQGHLITSSAIHTDPFTDSITRIQGDKETTIVYNAYQQPLAIQTEEGDTLYRYNNAGQCIAVTDPDGNTTQYEYNAWGNILTKQLPDSTLITYHYDIDLNLNRCELPNGLIWQAQFDPMGRKLQEYLTSQGNISNAYTYTYEEGYLTAMLDPLQRLHTYTYNEKGELIEDNVKAFKRSYTYDPRGALASAEQVTPRNGTPEHTLITRTYDPDSRIATESAYLNSELLFHTQQTWEANSRTLHTNGHTRTYVYQNNQLATLISPHAELHYTYTPSGSLHSITTPHTTTQINYHNSSFPQQILTQLPQGSFQENLIWNPSGKLDSYTSSSQQIHFTYTSRGQLKSANRETYEFDFGSPGSGIRTQAPNWHVPEDGLDPFGRIIQEYSDEATIVTQYNLMGQAIEHNGKQLDWDPWGRLITADGWEASYDALGRRLQTRHQGQTTTSIYDPEIEFREIGVMTSSGTYWKMVGPSGCDAITDEKGKSVTLLRNILGQLYAICTDLEQTFVLPPSLYGPQTFSSTPTDLFSYAQSLTWHSQSPDPTGLIYMGSRYYDPIGGHFLSPDPISYPDNIELYTYANGDPVNFFDPNGRFASGVYHSWLKPTLVQVEDALLAPLGTQFLIGVLNDWATICAYQGKTSSGTYQVGFKDLPKGGIGFINGIHNDRNLSEKHSSKLSQAARGFKVYGTYNATHSLPIDVLECAAGLNRIQTPPVEFLRQQWKWFAATHDSDAKFLQMCHSGGAIHVKNALLSVPRSIQQKIIVLAIAPATVVPDRLCFRSYNYASKHDFVPFLDIIGNLMYGYQLHFLTPHSEAPIWDHDFGSPTFDELIQGHINDYLENYGGEI